MAAWMIRSSRASVVSPGTISRRQIGGSVSMSVTFTWYVRGGSSFFLAAEVRGMGAILLQTDGPPRSTARIPTSRATSFQAGSSSSPPRQETHSRPGVLQWTRASAAAA
jgi:hypothetical protein